MPLGPFLITGLSITLLALIAAALALRGSPARNRRRCPKCWYTLDPAVGLTCSECGHTARSEQQLFRTRRRWKRALFCLLLAALAQLAWLEQPIRRGGLVAIVPSPILIEALPWIPDNWIARRGQLWQRSLLERAERGWLSDAEVTRLRRRAAHLAGTTRNPDQVRRAWNILTEVEDSGIPYHHSWPLTEQEVAGVLRLAVPIELETSGAEALPIFNEIVRIENSVAGRSPHDSSGALPARPAVRAALADLLPIMLPALPTHGYSDTWWIIHLLARADASPEITAALIGALDTDPGLAADALARIATRDPHTRAEFLRLLRSPEAPARAALATSAHALLDESEDPEVSAALLPLLQDQDPGVVHGAIYALARVPHAQRPAAERAVAFLLEQHDDPATRAEALAARLPWGRHVDLLIPLAHHEDPQVQSAALTLMLAALRDTSNDEARILAILCRNLLLDGVSVHHAGESEIWRFLADVAHARGWTRPPRDPDVRWEPRAPARTGATP